MTYELQPPSYTSLKVLTGPPRGGGGDTLWASQYAVYDALSVPMQKYLEGLTALHSAKMQAEGSRNAGRPVRRDPIVTEHPLVRTRELSFPSMYIPLRRTSLVLRYVSALFTPKTHLILTSVLLTPTLCRPCNRLEVGFL